MHDLYVASSWRNPLYPEVRDRLRAEGLTVHDWREGGFTWREVSADAGVVAGDTPDENPIVDAAHMERFLRHPASHAHFRNDVRGMDEARVGVLLLPCGRSAHAEFGYMAHAGKPLIVMQPHPVEPELLYALAGGIVATLDDLVEAVLARLRRRGGR